MLKDLMQDLQQTYKNVTACDVLEWKVDDFCAVRYIAVVVFVALFSGLPLVKILKILDNNVFILTEARNCIVLKKKKINFNLDPDPITALG